MSQAMPHILLVDDDRRIRHSLQRFLADNGFRITCVDDGRNVLQTFAVGRYDLVLLDIMLPGIDGLTLCRKLRQERSVPIILITALVADTERIVGLEIGADDYVCKPFNPRELLARMRAVLRRTAEQPAAAREAKACFTFEGWRLDVPSRTLFNPTGDLVALTSGETELLIALVTHPQIVLTRDQLLDLAHGRASVIYDRSIDVQISRLRRKIEANPQLPALIKTVRSGGYIFTPQVHAVDAIS